MGRCKHWKYISGAPSPFSQEGRHPRRLVTVATRHGPTFCDNEPRKLGNMEPQDVLGEDTSKLASGLAVRLNGHLMEEIMMGHLCSWSGSPGWVMKVTISSRWILGTYVVARRWRVDFFSVYFHFDCVIFLSLSDVESSIHYSQGQLVCSGQPRSSALQNTSLSFFVWAWRISQNRVFTRITGTSMSSWFT